MNRFFDTSYLFRIYTAETGHQRVKDLLLNTDVIASGWHARAEFSAALHRKKREGSLSGEETHCILEQFLHDVRAGGISLLPLEEPVLCRLEAVLQQAASSVFLRSADALHLACAAEHGFSEIYSNDRHLLAAAPLFGLKGIDILPP